MGVQSGIRHDSQTCFLRILFLVLAFSQPLTVLGDPLTSSIFSCNLTTDDDTNIWQVDCTTGPGVYVLGLPQSRGYVRVDPCARPHPTVHVDMQWVVKGSYGSFSTTFEGDGQPQHYKTNIEGLSSKIQLKITVTTTLKDTGSDLHLTSSVGLAGTKIMGWDVSYFTSSVDYTVVSHTWKESRKGCKGGRGAIGHDGGKRVVGVRQEL